MSDYTVYSAYISTIMQKMGSQTEIRYWHAGSRVMPGQMMLRMAEKSNLEEFRVTSNKWDLNKQHSSNHTQMLIEIFWHYQNFMGCLSSQRHQISLTHTFQTCDLNTQPKNLFTIWNFDYHSKISLRRQKHLTKAVKRVFTDYHVARFKCNIFFSAKTNSWSETEISTSTLSERKAI